MDPVVGDAARSQPASAADLAPFLVVAPLVAVITFKLGLSGSWSDLTLAWTSALAAGVLGLPVLVWLIDRGSTGFVPVTIAMVAASALPAVVVVLSGMVGHAARGGLDYLGWVLERGAPIPIHGLLSWRAFVRVDLLSMLAGGLTGALYALSRRTLVAARIRPGSPGRQSFDI